MAAFQLLLISNVPYQSVDLYVLKDIKHFCSSVDAMTLVKGQKEKCKITILIFALFCSSANLLLIQETLVVLLLMSKFAKL